MPAVLRHKRTVSSQLAEGRTAGPLSVGWQDTNGAQLHIGYYPCWGPEGEGGGGYLSDPLVYMPPFYRRDQDLREYAVRWDRMSTGGPASQVQRVEVPAARVFNHGSSHTSFAPMTDHLNARQGPPSVSDVSIDAILGKQTSLANQGSGIKAYTAGNRSPLSPEHHGPCMETTYLSLASCCVTGPLSEALLIYIQIPPPPSLTSCAAYTTH